LKKDERFIQVTRAVRRLRGGCERQKVLRDFWEEVYRNHFRQAQGEYFIIRGQWLAEDTHLLDEEREEEETSL
jgi:hypothetical protein